MGRKSLSDKYQREREEICKKLIDIVGLEFYKCDLDSNLDKQSEILSLKDEIQAVFAVSNIATFRPCMANDVKRDYLNIIRAILKQQGYTIIGCYVDVPFENGLFKRTTKYNIFRNLS